MIPKSALFCAAILGLAVVAGAAPCAPGNAAIHDFQVGDIFQYRYEAYLYSAGILKHEAWRKVRVFSKSGAPQARNYAVEIRTRYDVVRADGSRTRTYSAKDSTLFYADSAGHSLNFCAGDTVPSPSPGFGHTTVEAAEGDTGWYPLAKPGIRMKRVGKRQFFLPGEPAVVDASQPIHVYAEGLGLVHRTVSGFFGPWITETLAGYSKAGDNRGVVLSDEELSQPVAIRGPVAARSGAWAGRPGSAKEGFDLTGRKAVDGAGWNIRVTPPARD